MSPRATAVVLHERVPQDAPADAADVLVQAEVASAALHRLGYAVRRLEVDDLAQAGRLLAADRPHLVFNLVESLGGRGRDVDEVPALLEHLGVPFTGAGSEAMRLTTAKLQAKALLARHGIDTPDWWTVAPAAEGHSRWIVKSAWEDASHGLDDGAVVEGVSAAGRRLTESRERWGGEWFAERFVEGREFNVSLLADGSKPLVLPLAEIEFRDFPAGKPKIVGYPAKWDAASFEYANTRRRFVDETAESRLAARLRSVSIRCWQLFALRGYARVDLRVDENGRLWVLEINANPCLSPDAGFAAALAAAGIGLDDAIGRIVAEASGPLKPRAGFAARARTRRSGGLPRS